MSPNDKRLALVVWAKLQEQVGCEHAFARLRQKTGFGKEVYAYAYRHRYITEALNNGVDSVIVAHLVGHKGTDIIKRHYSHPEIDQLHKAALKATGNEK